MSTYIKKSFKLNEKDLFNYYLTFTFRKKYQFLAVTILFATTFIATILAKKDTFMKNLLQIASLIGIVSIVILPITLKFRAKKDYSTNKLINRTLNYTFKEDGIYIETDSGKSMVKWSELYEMRETKHHLYLYVGSNQAIILPKQYFDHIEIEEIKKKNNSK